MNNFSDKAVHASYVEFGLQESAHEGALGMVKKVVYVFHVEKAKPRISG